MLAYTFSFRARRAVQNNLAVVVSSPPTSTTVRRTALRAFQYNSKNWIDSLRLGTISKEEIERRVTVEGWDLLEDAMNSKRGVILIGMHVGNIDIVGQILAARGYPITVPVEPVRPESLFLRTQKLRQSLGIRTIIATNSARALLRDLKEGRVVGITADRNLATGGIAVDFFGQTATVSKAPAWLVTYSSAPVFVGTGVRQADESFAGRVEPLDVSRTGNRAKDLELNAQLIISAAESRIHEHPEQWCMFVPVWNGQ